MVRFAFLLLLAVAAVARPAAADDQDRARAALERGEIRPLDQVLAAAKAAVPGDVVKLDLKQKKDVWLYRLKILTPSGKRREVKIDAKTLAIIDSDDDDDDD
jgi:uncharacterized membrane protein YkoI